MSGDAEERKKQEEKVIKMTTTPVEKLICSLAGPTIVSMLVTSFYNMADTFSSGRSAPAPRRRWESYFP